MAHTQHILSSLSALRSTSVITFSQLFCVWSRSTVLLYIYPLISYFYSIIFILDICNSSDMVVISYTKYCFMYTVIYIH